MCLNDHDQGDTKDSCTCQAKCDKTECPNEQLAENREEEPGNQKKWDHVEAKFLLKSDPRYWDVL